MVYHLYGSVVVITVCLCGISVGRNALGFGRRGSFGLGSSCEYDDDCVIDHSFCRHQEVCDCRRGFVPSEDGTQCLTLIGSYCETSFDCNSLEHSECRQETCQCETRFVANKGGTKCLPKVAAYRGDCQLDTQCKSIMGENTFCNQGHCECMPHHHYSNIDQRCFYNKGLYQMCINSSYCYLGDDFSTSFVECVSGQCNCRQGYVATEDHKCRNSSTVVLQNSYLILLLIVLVCKLY